MKNVDYTEIADKIRNVSGGMYYHFGIASEILAYLQNLQNMQTVKEAGVLSLQLNVDGVPVSKSTNGQFWPVLGKIDKPFIGQPFTIGLFYGTTKPSSLEILDDFCNEYTELRENGIEVDGTVVSLSISAVVCDAPVTAFLKNIKGHTSYSACERCTERGVWVGTMTLPVSNAERRTDQSFVRMDDSEHHRGATPPHHWLILGLAWCQPSCWIICI